MKQLKTFYYRILILLLASGLHGCAAMQQIVKKPTVQIETVNIHSLSLTEGSLAADVQIHNPNAFALPVRQVVYHLNLNGHHLLDGQLSLDKQIPAQGALTIPVSVRFHYRDAIDSINSILHKKQISFELFGEVNLDLFKVPFSKRGRFIF